jgi:Matrixin
MPTVQPLDSSTHSRPARSARIPRGALRGFDILLIVLLGAIGVFVGSQVLSRALAFPRKRPASRVVEAPTRPAVQPASQQTATDSSRLSATMVTGDMAVSTIKSSTPAPVHDLSQIKALIAETPGTYMTDMIADLDGHLVRWPDRRQEGLRVWVQSSPTVASWDERYAQMARDAFDDWGRDSELPIRFDYVLDSASSDIHILWVDRFPATFGQRVGMTRRTTDQFGWLVNAEINVAIHDSTGRTIPPQALAGIVRHEAGHALGLGHSKDPRTKMFATEMLPVLASADRSTLRLLYRLPPGPAR